VPKSDFNKQLHDMIQGVEPSNLNGDMYKFNDKYFVAIDSKLYQVSNNGLKRVCTFEKTKGLKINYFKIKE
jgi:hypothetical protein